MASYASFIDTASNSGQDGIAAWAENGLIYYALWDPKADAWGDAQTINNASGGSNVTVTSGHLIRDPQSGLDIPAVLISWESGIDNEASLYGVIGSYSNNGELLFSDQLGLLPQGITVKDHSVGLEAGGDVLIAVNSQTVTNPVSADPTGLGPEAYQDSDINYYKLRLERNEAPTLQNRRNFSGSQFQGTLQNLLQSSTGQSASTIGGELVRAWVNGIEISIGNDTTLQGIGTLSLSADGHFVFDRGSNGLSELQISASLISNTASGRTNTLTSTLLVPTELIPAADSPNHLGDDAPDITIAVSPLNQFGNPIATSRAPLSYQAVDRRERVTAQTFAPLRTQGANIFRNFSANGALSSSNVEAVNTMDQAAQTRFTEDPFTGDVPDLRDGMIPSASNAYTLFRGIEQTARVNLLDILPINVKTIRDKLNGVIPELTVQANLGLSRIRRPTSDSSGLLKTYSTLSFLLGGKSINIQSVSKKRLLNSLIEQNRIRKQQSQANKSFFGKIKSSFKNPNRYDMKLREETPSERDTRWTGNSESTVFTVSQGSVRGSIINSNISPNFNGSNMANMANAKRQSFVEPTEKVEYKKFDKGRHSLKVSLRNDSDRSNAFLGFKVSSTTGVFPNSPFPLNLIRSISFEADKSQFYEYQPLASAGRSPSPAPSSITRFAGIGLTLGYEKEISLDYITNSQRNNIGEVSLLSQELSEGSGASILSFNGKILGKLRLGAISEFSELKEDGDIPSLERLLIAGKWDENLTSSILNSYANQSEKVKNFIDIAYYLKMGFGMVDKIGQTTKGISAIRLGTVDVNSPNLESSANNTAKIQAASRAFRIASVVAGILADWPYFLAARPEFAASSSAYNDQYWQESKTGFGYAFESLISASAQLLNGAVSGGIMARTLYGGKLFGSDIETQFASRGNWFYSLGTISKRKKLWNVNLGGADFNFSLFENDAISASLRSALGAGLDNQTPLLAANSTDLSGNQLVTLQGDQIEYQTQSALQQALTESQAVASNLSLSSNGVITIPLLSADLTEQQRSQLLDDNGNLRSFYLSLSSDSSDLGLFLDTRALITAGIDPESFQPNLVPLADGLSAISLNPVESSSSAASDRVSINLADLYQLKPGSALPFQIDQSLITSGASSDLSLPTLSLRYSTTTPAAADFVVPPTGMIASTDAAAPVLRDDLGSAYRLGDTTSSTINQATPTVAPYPTAFVITDGGGSITNSTEDFLLSAPSSDGSSTVTVRGRLLNTNSTPSGAIDSAVLYTTAESNGWPATLELTDFTARSADGSDATLSLSTDADGTITAIAIPKGQAGSGYFLGDSGAFTAAITPDGTPASSASSAYALIRVIVTDGIVTSATPLFQQQVGSFGANRSPDSTSSEVLIEVPNQIGGIGSGLELNLLTRTSLDLNYVDETDVNIGGHQSQFINGQYTSDAILSYTQGGPTDKDTIQSLANTNNLGLNLPLKVHNFIQSSGWRNISFIDPDDVYTPGVDGYSFDSASANLFFTDQEQTSALLFSNANTHFITNTRDLYLLPEALLKDSSIYFSYRQSDSNNNWTLSNPQLLSDPSKGGSNSSGILQPFFAIQDAGISPLYGKNNQLLAAWVHTPEGGSNAEIHVRIGQVATGKAADGVSWGEISAIPVTNGINAENLTADAITNLSLTYISDQPILSWSLRTQRPFQAAALAQNPDTYYRLDDLPSQGTIANIAPDALIANGVIISGNELSAVSSSWLGQLSSMPIASAAGALQRPFDAEDPQPDQTGDLNPGLAFSGGEYALLPGRSTDELLDPNRDPATGFSAILYVKPDAASPSSADAAPQIASILDSGLFNPDAVLPTAEQLSLPIQLRRVAATEAVARLDDAGDPRTDDAGTPLTDTVNGYRYTVYLPANSFADIDDAGLGRGLSPFNLAFFSEATSVSFEKEASGNQAALSKTIELNNTLLDSVLSFSLNTDARLTSLSSGNDEAVLTTFFEADAASPGDPATNDDSTDDKTTAELITFDSKPDLAITTLQLPGWSLRQRIDENGDQFVDFNYGLTPSGDPLTLSAAITPEQWSQVAISYGPDASFDPVEITTTDDNGEAITRSVLPSAARLWISGELQAQAIDNPQDPAVFPFLSTDHQLGYGFSGSLDELILNDNPLTSTARTFSDLELSRYVNPNSATEATFQSTGNFNTNDHQWAWAEAETFRKIDYIPSTIPSAINPGPVDAAAAGDSTTLRPDGKADFTSTIALNNLAPASRLRGLRINLSNGETFSLGAGRLFQRDASGDTVAIPEDKRGSVLALLADNALLNQGSSGTDLDYTVLNNTATLQLFVPVANAKDGDILTATSLDLYISSPSQQATGSDVMAVRQLISPTNTVAFTSSTTTHPSSILSSYYNRNRIEANVTRTLPRSLMEIGNGFQALLANAVEPSLPDTAPSDDPNAQAPLPQTYAESIAHARLSGLNNLGVNTTHSSLDLLAIANPSLHGIGGNGTSRGVLWLLPVGDPNNSAKSDQIEQKLQQLDDFIAAPSAALNSVDLPGLIIEGRDLQSIGSSVLFADLTGDGTPELIIGASQAQNSDGSNIHGELILIEGRHLATSLLNKQSLNLSDLNKPDSPLHNHVRVIQGASSSELGAALAFGAIGAGGTNALAIGAPGFYAPVDKAVEGYADYNPNGPDGKGYSVGAVHTIAANNPDLFRREIATQDIIDVDTPLITGALEYLANVNYGAEVTPRRFGQTLAITSKDGDFSGDQVADLVIGIPGLITQTELLAGINPKLVTSEGRINADAIEPVLDQAITLPPGLQWPAGEEGVLDLDDDNTLDDPEEANSGGVLLLGGGLASSSSADQAKKVLLIGDTRFGGPAAAGSALATGDSLTGNSIDDLAIALPSVSWSNGQVNLIDGATIRSWFEQATATNYGIADQTRDNGTIETAGTIRSAALDATLSISGGADTQQYGSALSLGSDINGDGSADLVIGDRFFDNQSGRVNVIFGAPDIATIASDAESFTAIGTTATSGSTSYSINLDVPDVERVLTLYSAAQGQQLGTSLLTANLHTPNSAYGTQIDPLADLILPTSSAGSTLNVVAGKPFLNQIGGFNLQDLGGVDGYEVSRPNNSEEANSSFAFLGDINGDGLSDAFNRLVASSPAFGISYGGNSQANPNQSDAGTGGSDGLNLTNQFGVQLGTSADARISSVHRAGDLNLDGIGDLILNTESTPSYALELNADGVLSLRGPGNALLWSAEQDTTLIQPGYELGFSANGNTDSGFALQLSDQSNAFLQLIDQASSEAIWQPQLSFQSRSFNHRDPVLAMQADGNITLTVTSSTRAGADYTKTIQHVAWALGDNNNPTKDGDLNNNLPRDYSYLLALEPNGTLRRSAYTTGADGTIELLDDSDATYPLNQVIHQAESDSSSGQTRYMLPGETLALGSGQTHYLTTNPPLQLSAPGGSILWSPDQPIAGGIIRRLTMKENGNLVAYNTNNEAIWSLDPLNTATTTNSSYLLALASNGTLSRSAYTTGADGIIQLLDDSDAHPLNQTLYTAPLGTAEIGISQYLLPNESIFFSPDQASSANAALITQAPETTAMPLIADQLLLQSGGNLALVSDNQPTRYLGADNSFQLTAANDATAGDLLLALEPNGTLKLSAFTTNAEGAPELITGDPRNQVIYQAPATNPVLGERQLLLPGAVLSRATNSNNALPSALTVQGTTLPSSQVLLGGDLLSNNAFSQYAVPETFQTRSTSSKPALNRLLADQALNPGEALQSPNGQFTASMQPGGNFLITKATADGNGSNSSTILSLAALRDANGEPFSVDLIDAQRQLGSTPGTNLLASASGIAFDNREFLTPALSQLVPFTADTSSLIKLTPPEQLSSPDSPFRYLQLSNAGQLEGISAAGEVLYTFGSANASIATPAALPQGFSLKNDTPSTTLTPLLSSLPSAAATISGFSLARTADGSLVNIVANTDNLSLDIGNLFSRWVEQLLSQTPELSTDDRASIESFTATLAEQLTPLNNLSSNPDATSYDNLLALGQYLDDEISPGTGASFRNFVAGQYPIFRHDSITLLDATNQTVIDPSTYSARLIDRNADGHQELLLTSSESSKTDSHALLFDLSQLNSYGLLPLSQRLNLNNVNNASTSWHASQGPLPEGSVLWGYASLAKDLVQNDYYLATTNAGYGNQPLLALTSPPGRDVANATRQNGSVSIPLGDKELLNHVRSNQAFEIKIPAGFFLAKKPREAVIRGREGDIGADATWFHLGSEQFKFGADNASNLDGLAIEVNEYFDSVKVYWNGQQLDQFNQFTIRQIADMPNREDYDGMGKQMNESKQSSAYPYNGDGSHWYQNLMTYGLYARYQPNPDGASGGSLTLNMGSASRYNTMTGGSNDVRPQIINKGISKRYQVDSIRVDSNDQLALESRAWSGDAPGAHALAAIGFNIDKPISGPDGLDLSSAQNVGDLNGDGYEDMVALGQLSSGWNWEYRGEDDAYLDLSSNNLKKADLRRFYENTGESYINNWPDSAKGQSTKEVHLNSPYIIWGNSSNALGYWSLSPIILGSTETFLDYQKRTEQGSLEDYANFTSLENIQIKGGSDFNGDGFDDLLIADSKLDEKGKTFILYGNRDLGDARSYNNWFGSFFGVAGTQNSIYEYREALPEGDYRKGSFWDGYKFDIYIDKVSGKDGILIRDGDKFRFTNDTFYNPNSRYYDSLSLDNSDKLNPNHSASFQGINLTLAPEGVHVDSFTGIPGYTIDGIDGTGNTNDFNGDGLADLYINTEANPGENLATESAYILYGNQDLVIPDATEIDGTPYSDSLTGTVVNDNIFGFAGDDIIQGLGGLDVINGGPGNDLIHVTGDQFRSVNGGTGTDALALRGSLDQSWNFAALANRIHNIESVSLEHYGANNLILNAAALAAITSSEGNLFVDGDQHPLTPAQTILKRLQEYRTDAALTAEQQALIATTSANYATLSAGVISDTSLLKDLNQSLQLQELDQALYALQFPDQATPLSVVETQLNAIISKLADDFASYTSNNLFLTPVALSNAYDSWLSERRTASDTSDSAAPSELEQIFLEDSVQQQLNTLASEFPTLFPAYFPAGDTTNTDSRQEPPLTVQARNFIDLSLLVENSYSSIADLSQQWITSLREQNSEQPGSLSADQQALLTADLSATTDAMVFLEELRSEMADAVASRYDRVTLSSEFSLSDIQYLDDTDTSWISFYSAASGQTLMAPGWISVSIDPGLTTNLTPTDPTQPQVTDADTTEPPLLSSTPTLSSDELLLSSNQDISIAASTPTVNRDASSITYTFTRSGDTTGTTRLIAKTVGDTADLVPPFHAEVVFQPGELRQTIAVPLNPQSELERQSSTWLQQNLQESVQLDLTLLPQQASGPRSSSTHALSALNATAAFIAEDTTPVDPAQLPADADQNLALFNTDPLDITAQSLDLDANGEADAPMLFSLLAPDDAARASTALIQNKAGAWITLEDADQGSGDFTLTPATDLPQALSERGDRIVSFTTVDGGIYDRDQTVNGEVSFSLLPTLTAEAAAEATSMPLLLVAGLEGTNPQRFSGLEAKIPDNSELVWVRATNTSEPLSDLIVNLDAEQILAAPGQTSFHAQAGDLVGALLLSRITAETLLEMPAASRLTGLQKDNTWSLSTADSIAANGTFSFLSGNASVALRRQEIDPATDPRDLPLRGTSDPDIWSDQGDANGLSFSRQILTTGAADDQLGSILTATAAGLGANLLLSGSGGDTLFPGQNDLAYAGSGDDTIALHAHYARTDTGSGDDNVTLHAGGQLLITGSGDDTIINATTAASTDNGRLHSLVQGGSDSDIFVLTSPEHPSPAAPLVITDFDSSFDRFQLYQRGPEHLDFSSTADGGAMRTTISHYSESLGSVDLAVVQNLSIDQLTNPELYINAGPASTALDLNSTNGSNLPATDGDITSTLHIDHLISTGSNGLLAFAYNAFLFDPANPAVRPSLKAYIHNSAAGVAIAAGNDETDNKSITTKPFSDVELSVIKGTLDTLADQLDFNLTYTDDSTTSNLDIYYDTAINSGSRGAVHGIVLNNTNGSEQWSEMLLNADTLSSNSELFSFVVAHEIGHTLGMEHPFDGSDGDSHGTATSGATTADTVMAYTKPDANSPWPDIYTDLDWRALKDAWTPTNNDAPITDITISGDSDSNTETSTASLDKTPPSSTSSDITISGDSDNNTETSTASLDKTPPSSTSSDTTISGDSDSNTETSTASLDKTPPSSTSSDTTSSDTTSPQTQQSETTISGESDSNIDTITSLNWDPYWKGVDLASATALLPDSAPTLLNVPDSSAASTTLTRLNGFSLTANAGDNTLIAASGNRLDAAAGQDSLHSTTGSANTVFGGTDSDILLSSARGDILFGGSPTSSADPLTDQARSIADGSSNQFVIDLDSASDPDNLDIIIGDFQISIDSLELLTINPQDDPIAIDSSTYQPIAAQLRADHNLLLNAAPNLKPAALDPLVLRPRQAITLPIDALINDPDGDATRFRLGKAPYWITLSDDQRSLTINTPAGFSAADLANLVDQLEIYAGDALTDIRWTPNLTYGEATEPEPTPETEPTPNPDPEPITPDLPDSPVQDNADGETPFNSDNLAVIDVDGSFELLIIPPQDDDEQFITVSPETFSDGVQPIVEVEGGVTNESSVKISFDRIQASPTPLDLNTPTAGGGSIASSAPAGVSPSINGVYFNSAAGADEITGSEFNDFIRGGANDDFIDSGDGDDLIRSGAGSDIITTGEGFDLLYYTADQLDGSADTVLDLSTSDRIVLGENIRVSLVDNVATFSTIIDGVERQSSLTFAGSSVVSDDIFITTI